MDWSMVQGVISLAIAIAAFYYARKKDTHEDSTRAADVIAEIRTMRRDIGEMKDDMRAMRKEWREDHDKIVSMERDVTAIWKHIDKINGKETET